MVICLSWQNLVPSEKLIIARVAENPKTSLQQIHAMVMCCIVYR